MSSNGRYSLQPMVDHLDREFTEITLASVLPKFTVGSEGIEKCQGNTLPIELHVPHVRAARSVDATHLIIVSELEFNLFDPHIH